MYTFTRSPSNSWLHLVSACTAFHLVSACTAFHCSGAGASSTPPTEAAASSNDLGTSSLAPTVATNSTEPGASTSPLLLEAEPSAPTSPAGPEAGSLPPAAAAAAPSSPARQLLNAISGSSSLGDLPAAVGKVSPQAKPEGRLGAVTTRLLALMDLGLLGEEVLLRLHGMMPSTDGDGEGCAPKP